VRTTNPTRYWLLLRARVDNPQAGYPMRATLVAEANSIYMGGLILDPAPWLKVGAGAILFSVLVWLPLLRGITRSIRQLTETTRQIAEGRFYVRASSKRTDELGALAEAINQMASRLDGFVQGQKRFLGDVAHELCSPLARLQMTLGIIEQRADERQQGYARAATEKAEQIASLVNELLAFSKASFRAADVQLQPVNLLEAAQKAVRQEAPEGGPITIEIPNALIVLADDDTLVRALANLLRNAIRHGGGSEPVVVTATHEAKSGMVTISIADCGPGVPEAELSKIFDAFYRLDASRTRDTGGVGLGLTIVKACIESCHGSVIARNRTPHGLEMLVHLAEASPPGSPHF
jgi:two-component system sensor histidine kinase CpxA